MLKFESLFMLKFESLSWHNKSQNYKLISGNRYNNAPD